MVATLEAIVCLHPLACHHPTGLTNTACACPISKHNESFSLRSPRSRCGARTRRATPRDAPTCPAGRVAMCNIDICRVALLPHLPMVRTQNMNNMYVYNTVLKCISSTILHTMHQAKWARHTPCNPSRRVELWHPPTPRPRPDMRRITRPPDLARHVADRPSARSADPPDRPTHIWFWRPNNTCCGTRVQSVKWRWRVMGTQTPSRMTRSSFSNMSIKASPTQALALADVTS